MGAGDGGGAAVGDNASGADSGGSGGSADGTGGDTEILARSLARLLACSLSRHPRAFLTSTAGAGNAVEAGSVGVGDSGSDLSSKFSSFIGNPAIISIVADTIAAQSVQPPGREVYWTDPRIQTVSPEQRLGYGIKTYRGRPSTFKAMADAIAANDFVVIDGSQEALANCFDNRILQDPFMPATDLQKRFQRYCDPSSAHELYGGTDPSAVYPPVRKSKRLKGHPSPPQFTPIGMAASLALITQGGVPCHSGILRAVDVYCIWAHAASAGNIFQKLKEGGQNDPGDSKRSEIKLNLLPEVTARLKDEDDNHFYDRLAGRVWLLVDSDRSYTGLYQVLDLTDVHCTLDPLMGSTLFADATEMPVNRQDPHTDKRPEDNVRAFAVLSSVSSARAGKAVIGVKRNSASNIKKLLILRRHFVKFCLQIEEKMPEKLDTERLEIGWNIVCKLFKDENPGVFEMMSDVELQLLPFEYLVFDTDLIHWGGPYSISGYLNIRYHL